MHRPNPIQTQNFASLLKSLGISFTEDVLWLSSPNYDKVEKGYYFFIPVKLVQFPELILSVIPLLTDLYPQTAFRVVKSLSEASKVNNGFYGVHMLGKPLQIICSSKETAVLLAKRLVAGTALFQGLRLSDSVRIGEVVYVQRAGFPVTNILRALKDRDYRPFKASRTFNKPLARRIIGKFFIPVEQLQSSPKGNVYKGIDCSGFSFRWCLIKQANAHGADDIYSRDARSRLRWQKEVIVRLQDHIPTPRFLALSEYQHFSFLMTDFFEGTTLESQVKLSHNGELWAEMAHNVRMRLLQYFSEAVHIVEAIHKHGFVHRDISPANFLVNNQHKLCILDFELAYDVSARNPHPAYTLGTLGYAAPEQLKSSTPDFKEDVYSLGALLLFIVSGAKPLEFKYEYNGETMDRITGNVLLSETILRCLKPIPAARPDLPEIEINISKYLQSLKEIDHELETLY